MERETPLQHAPSQRAPVIRLEHGLPVITELRWCLVPSWAKDEKIAYSLINARSETVAEKPAFRSAFKKRRCLIPADGFYEWQALGAKLKQPWRFVRPDRQPFPFAGLWEHWRHPDDANAEPLETFTLLTTTPNGVAALVHDRMPVILDGEARNQWLDAGLAAQAEWALTLSPVELTVDGFDIRALDDVAGVVRSASVPEEPPVVVLHPFPQDRKLALEIATPTGVELIVETTTDLNAWTEAQRVTGQGSGTPVRVTITPQSVDVSWRPDKLGRW